MAVACQPFGTFSCKTHLNQYAEQPSASSHLTDSSISLEKLIRSSQTTKARLLHYFPPSPENPLPREDEPIDSWCGFHLDHSLLTGLCSVIMFFKVKHLSPDSIISCYAGHVSSPRGGCRSCCRIFAFFRIRAIHSQQGWESHEGLDPS